MELGDLREAHDTMGAKRSPLESNCAKENHSCCLKTTEFSTGYLCLTEQANFVSTCI